MNSKRLNPLFRRFKFRLYPFKTIQRVLEAQLELCRERYYQLLMKIKTTWQNKQQITQ